MQPGSTLRRNPFFTSASGIKIDGLRLVDVRGG